MTRTPESPPSAQDNESGGGPASRPEMGPKSAFGGLGRRRRGYDRLSVQDPPDRLGKAFQRERLLQEGHPLVQDPVADHRIIRESGDEENAGLRPARAQPLGELPSPHEGH